MPAVEPPAVKSLHDMTDTERRDLMRRRPAMASRQGMDIGGAAGGRRVVRGVTLVLATAAVGTAFVVAFYHFTNSWRVALVVVGLMLGYMAVIGRMVEGRADRIE